MATVLTYIYRPFEGTEIMEASCKRFFPLINTCTDGKYYGNPTLERSLVRAMKDMDDGELVIYSDGADTIFLDTFEPPTDYLLYSAEKACWPLPQIIPLYEDRDTPWKYLNGGNWCGPAYLAIEFLTKYVLPYIFAENNDCQSQQSVGYLAAKRDGFPIRLDYECKLFQSMAFEKEGDFTYMDTKLRNNWTMTFPKVLHYNGRTAMDKGIELYKNQLK